MRLGLSARHLNNIVSSVRKPKGEPRGWFSLKYYVLVFILAASLFTLQPAGYLDPISLLVRSLSLGINPAVNFIQGPLAALSGSGVPVLAEAAEYLYTFLKSTILSFQQPYFYQSLLISIIFLIILGLNLVGTRFWCRYLCPLGALLGVLSRFSLLSRSLSEGCPTAASAIISARGAGFKQVKNRNASSASIATTSVRPGLKVQP